MAIQDVLHLPNERSLFAALCALPQWLLLVARIVCVKLEYVQVLAILARKVAILIVHLQSVDRLRAEYDSLALLSSPTILDDLYKKPLHLLLKFQASDHLGVILEILRACCAC